MMFVLFLLGLPLVGSNLTDDVAALLQGPGGYILNAMHLHEFIFFMIVLIFLKPLLEYRVGNRAGIGMRSRGFEHVKSLLELCFRHRFWMQYTDSEEFILMIGNQRFVDVIC